MVLPQNPRTTKRLSPGSIHPLGATLTPEGVNFALYSRHANEVFLLLFDDPDGRTHRRHPAGEPEPVRLARPRPRL